MSEERTRRRPSSYQSIPDRVHIVESKVTMLEKRVRSLSDGDSSLGDGDLVGKRIRLSVEDGQGVSFVTGTVLGVSKYTIKMRLDEEKVIRTYRKGYIRWHEEV